MDDDHPNRITPEAFAALREKLNGEQSADAARQVLRGLAEDKNTPPIVRLHISTAILELASGRSVQSAMARLRRATGIDKL